MSTRLNRVGIPAASGPSGAGTVLIVGAEHGRTITARSIISFLMMLTGQNGNTSTPNKL